MTVSAARKPRADAQRNRDLLLAAAKGVFAENGAEGSLEEIARRAEVGIGTLYRHFPTRDALVEAVYRHEVEQLAVAARELSASQTPGEALHRWMRLFVDYVGAKKLIAPALSTVSGGPSAIYAASGMTITEATELLVRRAVEAGEVRADVEPEDVLRALVGFAYGHDRPGWQASALRLVDVLMAGLKA